MTGNRMKNRRHIVLGVVALASLTWSVVAMAASTSWGQVTEVRAGYADGHVGIKGLAKVANCDSDTIEFYTSDSNPEAVQSIATAALLSGRELKCYVNGCAGSVQRGVSCWLR